MSLLLALSLALQFFHQGMDLYYQGKYREAIAAFTEAIKNDPSLLKAYRERAKAEEKIGEYNRALEDVNYYLSKAPKDQDGLYLRMRIKIKRKDYSGALEDAEALLALAPQEPTYLYSKALILEALGKYTQASELFQKASELFLDEKYRELSSFKAKVDGAVASLQDPSGDRLAALENLEGLLQGKYPVHISPAIPFVVKIFFYGEGMEWFMAKNLIIEYCRRVPADRAWVWNLVVEEFNRWKQGKKKKEIKKMWKEVSSLKALMGIK